MKTSGLVFSSSYFRYLFVIPFVLLLIIGMIIPSDGSHGILSLKSLAFLASVMSLSAYPFFYKTLQLNQIKLFLFLTLFSLFLIVWIVMSVANNSDLSTLYDQFKLLFLTLSVVAMSIFVAQEQLLSYQNFLKILVYANFFYSLLKVTIVILFLIGVIDLEFFLEKIGIRYMSMAIYGDISRLQTSVDIVTPFLLFFVMQSNSLNVYFSFRFKCFYIFFSLLGILLSFSRFLLMAALFPIFLAWCHTNIWSKFKWLVFVILMSLIGLNWIGYDRVSSIIELRFFSRSAYESDSTRNKQMDALLTEFYQHPLLGKGMGSYSNRMIRDTTNLHSYEVQWVAFLMQFGLIGLLILIIPLIMISLEFFSMPFTMLKVSYLSIFLMWLAAGFFNPFLISLSSGILYALFAWTGRRLRIDELKTE